MHLSLPIPYPLVVRCVFHDDAHPMMRVEQERRGGYSLLLACSCVYHKQVIPQRELDDDFKGRKLPVIVMTFSFSLRFTKRNFAVAAARCATTGTLIQRSTSVLCLWNFWHQVNSCDFKSAQPKTPASRLVFFLFKIITIEFLFLF